MSFWPGCRGWRPRVCTFVLTRTNALAAAAGAQFWVHAMLDRHGTAPLQQSNDAPKTISPLATAKKTRFRCALAAHEPLCLCASVCDGIFTWLTSGEQASACCTRLPRDCLLGPRLLAAVTRRPLSCASTVASLEAPQMIALREGRSCSSVSSATRAAPLRLAILLPFFYRVCRAIKAMSHAAPRSCNLPLEPEFHRKIV